MENRRTIEASDLVDDLRARMTDVQLMAKYSLSAQDLGNIYQQLIEAKAVLRGEIYGRFPFLHDSVNLENIHTISGNLPALPLPVYTSQEVNVRRMHVILSKK